MAELESLGLLTRPHKSAGCMPTEKGLRVYLDHLLCPKLRPWDRSRLDKTAPTCRRRGESQNGTSGESKDFPNILGQALAHLAGQLAVVAVPRFANIRVRELGLVKVGDDRVLAYVLSVNGNVQQKLVRLDSPISADGLLEVQNYLNAQAAGATLGEIRARLGAELSQAHRACDSMRQRALGLGLCIVPGPTMHLIVEGTGFLAKQPEFLQPEQLFSLLSAIEQKERVASVVDSLLEGGAAHVLLGSEHATQHLEALACVGCAQAAEKGDRVAVGLMGPSRMDYRRLLPLVQYASVLLGRYWQAL